MGYHPETLAFSFPPYPRRRAKLGERGPWSFAGALYALKPWIGFDIWHIDPEKPGTGNRQDDSCGWFDRTPGEYADAVKHVLKDQTTTHEIGLVLQRRTVTPAPFYEGISERQLSYPRLAASDALAVVMMVAQELELRRWWNGRNGNSGAHGSLLRRTFTRRRNVVDQALSLALSPIDNLSSAETPKEMVRYIAAALNRRFRPWWRHPRWHVHHWKINFDLGRNLRRMFSRCPACRKPLGFGYSPFSPGDGKLYHGPCAGMGGPFRAEPA